MPPRLILRSTLKPAFSSTAAYISARIYCSVKFLLPTLMVCAAAGWNIAVAMKTLAAKAEILHFLMVIPFAELSWDVDGRGCSSSLVVSSSILCSDCAGLPTGPVRFSSGGALFAIVSATRMKSGPLRTVLDKRLHKAADDAIGGCVPAPSSSATPRSSTAWDAAISSMATRIAQPFDDGLRLGQDARAPSRRGLQPHPRLESA